MIKLLYKTLLFVLLLVALGLLFVKNYYYLPAVTQVDPIPHTKELVAEKRYAEASEYLGYLMQFDYVKNNQEAQTLYRTIEEKRSSLSYKSDKVVDGILYGKSDELHGQLGAIGSDFFIVGDIRDLLIEGNHYLHNKEVDEVLVALSSIGLIASASTIFTLGASTVPKAGVSLLKLSRRTKQMPTWLGKFIIKEAKVAKQTKSVQHLKPLLTSIHGLYKHTGLRGSLKLMSKSANPKQLRTLNRLSYRFGKETPMLATLSKQGEFIKSASTLEKASLKSVKQASLFGDNGYKRLAQIGESRFLKGVKFYKSVTKVVYKKEWVNLLASLQKYITNPILIAVALLTSTLLFPFSLFRKRQKVSGKTIS
jgi:hypothetical protein